MVLVKYDPSQPRDYHGRWTDTGRGELFVSPNVGNIGFAEAKAGVHSPRQQYLTRAFRAVDHALGLASDNRPIIGAWRDGAENSVISRLENVSWEQLRTAAAMKGWLANQKQVLAFREDEKGNAFMASFTAKGDLDSIHKYLLDNGLDYHTLEPVRSGGAIVHVYGDKPETAKRVQQAGEHYGAEVTARAGRGEFLGTQKEDGSDVEQRQDARQVYEKLVAGSGVQGAPAAWQRLRARYRRPDTVKRLERPNRLTSVRSFLSSA